MTQPLPVESQTTDFTRLPRWQIAIELLLIFAVFFLHGAWPVPDVNEPHYLSKAKHYWDTSWCANDFFVNTADAHQVFYWTFGWLTRFFTLDQTAWIGRLVTWALLAWAWRRLSWAALPRAWLAVLSAELFVLLNENAHMAGEWVVGGIEAKGFAYALVFLGLEAVVRARWNLAWLLFGAAGSFHVIVGGWAAVAGAIAWLAFGGDRPPLRAMLPGLFGGVVLAMPGLYFALSLTHGADPDTVRAANAIYVWQRLPHHLAADRFKEGFPSRHLMMWVLWLAMVTLSPADAAGRRLRWFVGATMLLALIGYLLVWLGGWAPEPAAAVLKFYWFRMSDVFVPVGVALVGLTIVDRLGATKSNARRLWLTGLILLAAYNLWSQIAHLPFNVIIADAAQVVPRSDKNLVYDDWLQTCAWIKQHTDPSDVFLTPRMSSTLRFYAGRGEVANWKDFPQDATGIVEWWKRMFDVHTLSKDNPQWEGKILDPAVLAKPPAPKFIESLTLLGPAKVNELARKYGANYAIVQLVPEVQRLPGTPEFESAGHAYGVYRLPIVER
jgi:hypothetical protein